MDPATHEPQRDLDRLQNGEVVDWAEFLDACAPTIDRVVRRITRDYDERMDLFLYVCEQLRAHRMRRIRAFKPEAAAPCSFTTYLAVVVRNLAVDHRRKRLGRFRMFTRVAALDAIDRQIADYRFREGRSPEETRDVLEHRHGLSLSQAELSVRIARVERALSPNQRWRLFARWSRHRPPLTVDPTDVIGDDQQPAGPLAATRGNPKSVLAARDVRRVFRKALAALPGKQQLVLAYRFVDGHDVAATARAMGVSTSGVERLTRDSLGTIRAAMAGARISRDDFEGAFEPGMWGVGRS